MSATATPDAVGKQPQFAGHPSGLFMLFFAEMWERFSYYGMRALLVLYIIKGFLSKSDGDAYAIYGAYAGLVYATPFIGGMLADRLLGARKAVILGGVLMAAGHLLMTWEAEIPFFAALSLLIVGNGFFKPNISAIVGSLYPEGSGKRDAGFTLFYIGINMGAAMAPLLCGYVGETWGWHYGFGLATIGMLVGLAVFVIPAGITRLIILATAFGTGGLMIYLNLNEVIYALAPNAGVAIALMVAGVVAFLAMAEGGLPEWAGQPPDLDKLKKPVAGIPAEYLVYILSFAIVPVIAGLMLADGAMGVLFSVVGIEVSLIGVIMLLLGGVGGGMLIMEVTRSTKVEADRLIVVMVLMFFSMLFWAFFEQAGSSINLFTDRNVDRVFETEMVTEAQVGSTVTVDVTQSLNGRTMGDKVITMTDIDAWRAEETKTVDWPVSEDDVGMGIKGSEVATSQFQAANPVFIMLFGLVFSGLWGWLGQRNAEPSTPVKFGLGIAQLAAGFGVSCSLCEDGVALCVDFVIQDMTADRVDGEVEAIELADLDQDGWLDVVAAYSLDGGGVSVLFGLGGGAFSAATDLPATYTGSAGGLALGDLDGDGLADVSLAEGATGQVSTWRNLGARTIAPGLRLGTGHGPTSAAVGLVDGDAVPDLVALVEPSGQGSWYYPAVVVLPGVPDPWTDLGAGLAGALGTPALSGSGPATPGANLRLELAGAAPGATAFLVAGLGALDLPFFGGTLVPTTDLVLAHPTGPAGATELLLTWPDLVPAGLELRFQTWILDAGGPQGLAATNALLATQP